MKHELVRYPNGTYSLREGAGGQIMHSSVGAWEEAQALYSSQAQIAERVLRGHLVVWDVGLGLGANALAAIEAARSAPGRSGTLRVWSFENDLEGLRTALARSESFPFYRGYETALSALLERGEWLSDGVEWRLLPGDFFARLAEAPPADVVFYDFYAPASCPALWTPDRFAALRARVAEQAVLYTYASATPVRIALLLAGFFVGRGASTGAKSDTTVASRSLAQVSEPLGAEWLDKLSRSSKAVPFGAPDTPEERARVRQALLAHPQFRAP